MEPAGSSRRTLGAQAAADPFEPDSLWDEAPCALGYLDSEMRLQAVNRMAAEFFRRPAAELVGVSLDELLDARSFADLLHGGAPNALTEAPFLREIASECTDGSGRCALLRLSQSPNRPGFLLALFAEPPRSELTRPGERELQEARVAASIVAASNDAIFSVSPEGLVLNWNHGAETLYGYTPQEIVGKPLAAIVPGERLPESRVRMEQVLAGRSVVFETVRLAKGGLRKSVAVSGAPIHDRFGRSIGVSTVHRDIEKLVRHEAQMRFVMRELAHRTKNLLAIIQSIERQTARGASSVEDFHERFASRLQALAVSHDLLVEANWSGAQIDDLVRRHLAPFADVAGDRISAQGPPIRLSPSVAQTIGLALHELATNATKYGALSSATGHVSIRWGALNPSDSEDKRLRIEWIESGGPLVKPPARSGFGLLAIERLAAQAVNGAAEVDFAESGLRWTLVAVRTFDEPSEEASEVG